MNFSYGNLKITTPKVIDPLLGKEAKEIAMIINYFMVCGSMAFLGIIGNVINLIIFTKLGFDNPMNISLSGIAVSDLCTLSLLIWFDICFNPKLSDSNEAIISFEVIYLTAGWPHCLFARITCIITVYITIERFLCVVLPLEVKKFITKSRTIIIVVSLFMSQLLTAVPTYYSNFLGWKFFPEKNRTLLGMYRTHDWEQVEAISFVLQSLMQGLLFVLLILFTFLLIWSLRKKTKWRQASTSNSQKETITLRDKKLVRMVILIAMILIVCFTPGMLCFCGMAIEPEYTMGGAYDNVFFVTFSVPFVFQTFNSSVNIFVYYAMSSKYRAMFDETFVWWRKLLGLSNNKLVTADD